MEAVVLKVSKREVTGGHSVKQVRREGAVPAIVYGRKAENRQVKVDGRELERYLRAHGTNGVVRLDIDGDTDTVALIKQVQLSPVGHDPMHIDFHAVVLDEVVRVQVTVEFEGRPAGEDEGGILNVSLRELEVECLPLEIPQALSIDVSGLNVGDALTAGQVALPEGVTLVTSADEAICSLSIPTLVAEPEEAEEAEGAEGEEAGEAGEEAGEAADGDADDE